MREPCELSLPTETFLCLPKDGQPSDSVRYHGNIHKIEYKVEGGSIVLQQARVAIVREELRITRSWHTLFQPRQTWVRVKDYDGGLIIPRYRANRLLCQSELERVATKLLAVGVHFTIDFLDWVLSPAEDQLNIILREINEQVQTNGKGAKLAS